MCTLPVLGFQFFKENKPVKKKYVGKKNVEAVLSCAKKAGRFFSSLRIVLLYRPQLKHKSQRSSIGRIAEGLIDSVSYWAVISGWVFNFNALT
mgnify:FL=1